MENSGSDSESHRTKYGRFSEPENLGQALNHLRNKPGPESLCDIHLIVDGETYKAHKAVLAAASPVFGKMFTNGMKESRLNKIPLEEIEGSVWRAGLDYIYTSTVDLDDSLFAMKLLEMARRYELRPLERRCIHFLSECLTRGHHQCLEVLTFADRFALPALKASALATIATNFHSVWRWSSFFELDESFVVDILSAPDLVIRGEREVFDAAIRWLTGRLPAQSPTIREGASDAESTDNDSDEHELNAAQRRLVAHRRTATERLLELVDVRTLNVHGLREMADVASSVQGGRAFAEACRKRMRAPRVACVPVTNTHEIVQRRGTKTLTFTYNHYGIRELTGGCTEEWEVHSPWVGDGSGLYWRMEVFPRGDETERHRYLGVYLRARDPNKRFRQTRIACQLYLVKPQTDTNGITPVGRAVNVSLMEVRAVHEIEELSIGDSCFMSIDRMLDSSRGFIDEQNCAITFGCTVYILGDTDAVRARIARKRKRRPQ